jgi:hypothetical protein
MWMRIKAFIWELGAWKVVSGMQKKAFTMGNDEFFRSWMIGFQMMRSLPARLLCILPAFCDMSA